jgi:hypothetical protein
MARSRWRRDGTGWCNCTVEPFALSERWNGWSDLNAMLKAARAAVEGGPLDPLICEVIIESDFDTVMLDSLEAAQEHVLLEPDPPSIEIFLTYLDEDEARITITYNGRWLQLNGSGSNWERAPGAYYAAQAELAAAYGITTFKLPKLPYDTVGELRRQQELAALEAALEDDDGSAR